MKKVINDPQLDTGCVKLYLDDILSIVEYMQEVSKDGELEITMGGYQFSSVVELSGIKQKEHESIYITYIMHSPHSQIRFWVDKKSAHLALYLLKDSLTGRGAYSNIEKIILARRRKLEWVNKFYSITSAFSIPALLFLLIGQVNNNSLLIVISSIFILILFITLIVFLLTIPIRRSKIILVEKVDHDTFWKRNKDTIIVSFITGIISLIVGILGTLFMQKIGK